MTGTNSVCHDYKFREIRDKNGLTWFQFLKKNKFCPHKQKYISSETVPRDAIMVTAKGRFTITGTWSEDKQLQFLKPKIDAEADYEILTSNQKNIYLRQMRSSEEWKKKTTAELIMQFATYGGLVIIVVALLIFYSEIAKPVLTMGDKVATMQQETTKQLQLIESIINDKQWVPAGIPLAQLGEIINSSSREVPS